MSSTSVIGAAVLLFIVAAFLYYQSRSVEAFATGPVAGRQYNPTANDDYKIPADLAMAPRANPPGTFPPIQQRSSGIPGTGSQREALAALGDLRELNDLILTWLYAATTKDTEQPGSLTHEQRQRMLDLQGRHEAVLEQLGTGMITDTYKQVAEETLKLRTENESWQAASPSIAKISSFGRGSEPDAFLNQNQYDSFIALFVTIIQQFEATALTDSLTKVRLQQLQVIQRDLADMKERPPIKVGAAKKFLQAALRVDQPLPTLISQESPNDSTNSSALFGGTVIFEEINLFPRISNVEIQTGRNPKNGSDYQDRRSNQGRQDYVGHQGRENQGRQDYMGHQGREHRNHPGSSYDPTDLVKRAKTLCSQIREAFPEDADALGCQEVTDNYQAETVINTVCSRLRYSVPSVTPEQFNCPPRNV